MKVRSVITIALIAAIVGALAGLWVRGPGPIWRSELGQRLLQGWLAREAPPGVVVAKLGQPVPALRLAALDGGMRRIPEDFAGRPILINLWASWCGPCIAEMPELERYSRTQGATGVQVIGIALDDATSVHDFLARVRVRYPIFLDTPGPADAGVRLGNVQGVLPYSLLIDANGRVLKQRIGPFAPGELDSFAAEAGLIRRP
ncbi:MAG: TlpA family protein disulfide reductase [Lysobacteraceae bacterium]|nr:MAG: TlpA family protein disulfide reductase [Xanthomonadaceae bacterium]